MSSTGKPVLLLMAFLSPEGRSQQRSVQIDQPTGGLNHCAGSRDMFNGSYDHYL